MTKFKQRLKVIGVFMCNWFLFSFMGWLIHGHFTPNYLSMFILQIIGCVITTYINLKIMKKNKNNMKKEETIKQFETVISFLKELPDELFDYSCYGDGCGTIGCVAGHYDTIFPNLWTFDKFGDPVRVGADCAKTTSNELSEFHNISLNEIFALFYGDTNTQKDLFLPVTHLDSSREKVIELFEAYLESIR